MKKSKFTEAQIVFAIKQAETGTPVNEVCRKMGISEATFYNWKKKYGKEVSEKPEKPTLGMSDIGYKVKAVLVLLRACPSVKKN
jgi:putative transposase